MNKKIRDYVEVLFSDIPRSQKANELKEELLSNMTERFDDYISQGKSENQAYSLVISNLGDVDEMLAEVMPDADFVSQARSYRRRNARNTAISVAMYIISPVFVIFFETLGHLSGYFELFESLGLLFFFLFIGGATALLIYSSMSTPPEYKDYNDQSKEIQRLYTGQHGRMSKLILSVYWLLVTLAYLTISFWTSRWDITWIIWVLSGVLHEIVKTILEMRYEDEVSR